MEFVDFLFAFLEIHMQLLYRLSQEIDAKVIKTMLHVASCHLLLATCCLPVAVVLVPVLSLSLLLLVLLFASGRIESRLGVVAATACAVLLLRVFTTTTSSSNNNRANGNSNCRANDSSNTSLPKARYESLALYLCQ